MKKICSSLTLACFIFVFVIGSSFAQPVVTEKEAAILIEKILAEFASKAEEVKNYGKAKADSHIEKVLHETVELASIGKISQEDVNSVRAYYEPVRGMDGKALSEHYLKTANNLQTLGVGVASGVAVLGSGIMMLGLGLFLFTGFKGLYITGPIMLIGGIIMSTGYNFI